YYFLYLCLGYIFCRIKKIYGSSLFHSVFEFHKKTSFYPSANFVGAACPGAGRGRRLPRRIGIRECSPKGTQCKRIISLPVIRAIMAWIIYDCPSRSPCRLVIICILPGIYYLI